MGKKWMWLVGCGLLAAGASVVMRAPDDGARPQAVGTDVALSPTRPELRSPRPGAPERPPVGRGGLTPRPHEALAPLPDELDDWTTAEIDAALDALIGDAESYWALSVPARTQYDRLEAARVARIGLPPAGQRLAPSPEALTLDGQPLRAEVSR